MRTRARYAVAWLAATAVAVFVAWQGVGVVTNEVTDRRQPTLSSADVESALEDASAAAGSGSTTTVPGTSTTGAGPSAEVTAVGSATTRDGDAGSPPAPAPASPTTAAPTPGLPPPPVPSATTTPTARPGPSATTAPPPTSAAAVTRSYNLIGGSAAVRFENGTVRLLWATPNDGFEVEVRDEDTTDEVEVEFTSEDHTSKLRAWWDDGPEDRVEESGESESDPD